MPLFVFRAGHRWRLPGLGLNRVAIRSGLALLVLSALLLPAFDRGLRAATLPPPPTGWPTTLELGLMDAPGGAASLRASAPYAFRYQYLSGGANTGTGWATWNPGGQFATYYIQDSLQHGVTPVFTYYMIYQSTPGNGLNEVDGVATNLSTTATMTAYYNDLKLFFQRAGAFPGTRVILHVEPDMWAYIQRRTPTDNAATVPVAVASTGLADLTGLPNTAAGLGQAIVRLRNSYAPNVLLGYHMSVWGTGTDISYTNPPDPVVDDLARRAAAFYQSLGASFDLVFAEFSDRDSGFKQVIYGDGGASWWDSGDFARHVRFLTTFVGVVQKRIVLWQIPLGNTKMRALNNTWNHFQDNRVEWLLDDPGRGHLTAYAQAGVVAFLFGRGADGTTCPCDANNDGVTNPAPINGNTGVSLTADDDGGFFRQKVAAYYAAGALPLPGGGGSVPTPTTTPVPTPTATPVPLPTVTPPSPPGGGAGTTWYFAEGYTGVGFDEYLTILNPNATNAAVRITYYRDGKAAVTKSLTAPANARTTVVVHDPALGIGRDEAVAARVETTNGVGIVVERPIYFRYQGQRDGGHAALGAVAAAPTWYFAEGYTGSGFDQYLTILNPSPTTAAQARITYYLASGGPIERTVSVPAASRATVAVHDASQVGRGQAVAAKVASTNGVNIVVERPIYFAYQGGVDGGHTVMGAVAARTDWYFAEGYTATGFDEYLTILNPSATAAQVAIVYYRPGQPALTKTISVPAARRATVAVHDTANGVGRGQEVAARVVSQNGVGIVVERSMYFRYTPAGGAAGAVDGGHNVMGASAPRLLWYFAEGYTAANFDEYLTILNPYATAAAVRITYYPRVGAPIVKTLSVPATARHTVAVHDPALGVGRGQEVAAKVESTNGVGIVVERPIYFTYQLADGGTVTGGHTVLGHAP